MEDASLPPSLPDRNFMFWREESIIHGHGGEFHPFCSRFLFAMLELFEPLLYAYSTSRTLWRPNSRETHVCLSWCRSLSAIPFSRCACKQYPRQSFRKRRRRRRRYDKKRCRILEMRFSAGLLFQRLAFLFFILLKCLSLSPPDPPSPCPPSPPLCRNHILQSEEALKMASYLSLLFPFFLQASWHPVDSFPIFLACLTLQEACSVKRRTFLTPVPLLGQTQCCTFEEAARKYLYWPHA